MQRRQRPHRPSFTDTVRPTMHTIPRMLFLILQRLPKHAFCSGLLLLERGSRLPKLTAVNLPALHLPSAMEGDIIPTSRPFPLFIFIFFILYFPHASTPASTPARQHTACQTQFEVSIGFSPCPLARPHDANSIRGKYRLLTVPGSRHPSPLPPRILTVTIVRHPFRDCYLAFIVPAISRP